jgi:hypothetical protein
MDIGTKSLPLSLSQIVLHEISTKKKKKHFYVAVANLSLSLSNIFTGTKNHHNNFLVILYYL